MDSPPFESLYEKKQPCVEILLIHLVNNIAYKLILPGMPRTMNPLRIASFQRHHFVDARHSSSRLPHQIHSRSQPRAVKGHRNGCHARAKHLRPESGDEASGIEWSRDDPLRPLPGRCIAPTPLPSRQAGVPIPPSLFPSFFPSSIFHLPSSIFHFPPSKNDRGGPTGPPLLTIPFFTLARSDQSDCVTSPAPSSR